MIDHLLRVVERVDFLRQALMTVATVGPSANVAGDRPWLDRLAPIDASLTSASAGLRRHAPSIIVLSGFAARAVLSEMVNDGLRLWDNDPMRSPSKCVRRQCHLCLAPRSTRHLRLRSLAPVPFFARAGVTLSISLQVCTPHATAGTRHPSGTAAPPPPRWVYDQKEERGAVQAVFVHRPMPVLRLRFRARYYTGRFLLSCSPPRRGGISAAPTGKSRGSAVAQVGGSGALLLHPDGGLGRAVGGGGAGSR